MNGSNIIDRGLPTDTKKYSALFLSLKEYSYSSPGWFDIAGIGKVIESTFEIIKYYFPNKDQQVKTAVEVENLLQKKIENLKRMGYSNKEIKKMYEKAIAGSKVLSKFTNTGLIENVEMIEDDDII